MTGAYFHAVFDKDTTMLFNGLPAEARKWLEENPFAESLWVHNSETGQILSSSEYLDLEAIRQHDTELGFI